MPYRRIPLTTNFLILLIQAFSEPKLLLPILRLHLQHHLLLLFLFLNLQTQHTRFLPTLYLTSLNVILVTD